MSRKIGAGRRPAQNGPRAAEIPAARGPSAEKLRFYLKPAVRRRIFGLPPRAIVLRAAVGRVPRAERLVSLPGEKQAGCQRPVHTESRPGRGRAPPQEGGKQPGSLIRIQDTTFPRKSFQKL